MDNTLQSSIEDATAKALNNVTDKDDTIVWNNRTKMAWVSLVAIILPTLYIILRIGNPDLIEKLGMMLSWYYISLASIIGFYFGAHAWATIQGK